MKRTANYDLPTWEQDDAIRMKDFNDLTGKLDAALKSGADANASASAALTARPRSSSPPVWLPSCSALSPLPLIPTWPSSRSFSPPS